MKIRGLCMGCGAATGSIARRKLEAQHRIFGQCCPILECARDHHVAVCLRDCRRFPCRIFEQGPAPFSASFLRVQKAVRKTVRPPTPDLERMTAWETDEIDPEYWERLIHSDPEEICRRAVVSFSKDEEAYAVNFLGNAYNIHPFLRTLTRARRRGPPSPYRRERIAFGEALILLNYLLGLSYVWQRGEREFSIVGYYNYRKTVLFTNYTYFLLNPDPAEGDQYELWESRNYGGVRSSYSLPSPLFGLDLQTKVGLDARLDQVHQMQWNTHTRDRFNKITDYDFLETNLGGYFKETLFVNKHLQLMAGLRLDAVIYDVEGTQDVDFKNLCANRADTLQDVPVFVDTYQWTYSPKASVVITPFDRPGSFFRSLDLFLNYGEGFYTTRAPLVANQEAPDVSSYPEAPCAELPTRYAGIRHDIPKARGAEGAFRLFFWERKASLAATIWWADKEEELVFEPETGISIPRGSGRRVGQEVELRMEPLDWLYLTFDLFYTKAEFQDEQAAMSSDAIPGTPEFIFQHVVSVRHPTGFHGSLRGRYVGERPLPRERPLSTLYSDPYYVMDLLAGYEKRRWAVVIAIENLFDTEWDDTSYAYPSSPEPSPTRPAGTATYQGKYITPGTPFAIRGEVSLKF